MMRHGWSVLTFLLSVFTFSDAGFAQPQLLPCTSGNLEEQTDCFIANAIKSHQKNKLVGVFKHPLC
jgi:hypothetical protein